MNEFLNADNFVKQSELPTPTPEFVPSTHDLNEFLNVDNFVKQSELPTPTPEFVPSTHDLNEFLNADNFVKQSELPGPQLNTDQLASIQANANLNASNSVVSFNDMATANFIKQGGTLNFLDFVTLQTDKDIIQNRTPTNASTATAFATRMAGYFNNMIVVVKAQKIGRVVFPTGLYKFIQVVIDGVTDCIFDGDKCQVQDNSYLTTTSMWKFTNCTNVQVKGFKVQGTYGSYSDFDFIHISTGCSFIDIYSNTFSNFRRSCIYIDSLLGGVSSEGVNIYNNKFRGANFANNQQTCIILGEDGEYCQVFNNNFKQVASAIRFINGANSGFFNNIILSSLSQGFDINYNRALIYADITGTNSGKLFINNNVINHNGDGITAIVIKGSNAIANSSRIQNNNILVHGTSTNSTAIYVENSPRTMVIGNKLAGNATLSSSGIIIKNSPKLILDKNEISNYVNGIEIQNSLNVDQNKNYFDNVTNSYLADGTSSFI